MSTLQERFDAAKQARIARLKAGTSEPDLSTLEGRVEHLSRQMEVLICTSEFDQAEIQISKGADWILRMEELTAVKNLEGPGLSEMVLTIKGKELERIAESLEVKHFANMTKEAARHVLGSVPLIRRAQIVFAICPLAPLQLKTVVASDPYGRSAPVASYCAAAEAPEASAFVAVTDAPEKVCRQIATDEWLALLHERVDRQVFNLAAGHGVPLMEHEDAPPLPSLE